MGVNLKGRGVHDDDATGRPGSPRDTSEGENRLTKGIDTLAPSMSAGRVQPLAESIEKVVLLSISCDLAHGAGALNKSFGSQFLNLSFEHSINLFWLWDFGRCQVPSTLGRRIGSSGQPSCIYPLI
ncbi:hypothetical protein THAOC_37703 [Thalassiosira oceanica]|uniref:Uncharacterized protein n=1 Tax=Thalassiosira oceanica TaxID=159749 RepID=K0QZP8_THAOC|nr:hypothetical protein THAOC_37703 [Thalassiosira oceanica]|eukprot:EJK43814.1 hypothetical protein THAOC_37703 [Thalassiosira oceanica]